MKVVVNIKGNWVYLKDKDTINGVHYNVATPELYPTPSFVEIIHNGEKYYINSIFIQYVPESTSKSTFSFD